MNKKSTPPRIYMAFFHQAGENAWKPQPGKLARNVLRRDYQRFLFENNLPRDFDQLELEKVAKSYRGPIEKQELEDKKKLQQS